MNRLLKYSLLTSISLLNASEVPAPETRSTWGSWLISFVVSSSKAETPKALVVPSTTPANGSLVEASLSEIWTQIPLPQDPSCREEAQQEVAGNDPVPVSLEGAFKEVEYLAAVTTVTERLRHEEVGERPLSPNHPDLEKEQKAETKPENIQYFSKRGRGKRGNKR